MTDKSTAEIAQDVSLLLQLDRTRHQVSSKVDMAVLANIPAHLSSVFEQANAVDGNLTPAQLYALVNKRISDLQAQVYLLRLEMDNRSPHDPANIYTDPMVVSAYGERIEGLTTQPRSFSFGPEVLATGWYPMEVSGEICHRWMRPAEVSVACLPHLGTCAQTIEIEGYVMHDSQFENLEIRAAGQTARIDVTKGGSVTRFKAVLTLQAEDVKAANYLPVEFRMTEFKTPNGVDTRMLGANIHGFTCRPVTRDTSEA